MRPAVVQRSIVLMHFDFALAERFAREGKRAMSWLDDDEVALLQRVDARAFGTDPERRLRLIAALLEEYPVSCALVGAAQLPQFIASPLFRGAILKDRLVVDAFGDWLFARAGDVALLEQAIAMARRRRRRRPGAAPGCIVRASGVECARLQVGTLAWFAGARALLGDKPHETVARGSVSIGALPSPDASIGVEGGHEFVLVVAAGAGDGNESGVSPDVSTCAEPLFALLSFARDARSRADLEAEARRLGADDDAASLVDDLLRDGLLAIV